MQGGTECGRREGRGGMSKPEKSPGSACVCVCVLSVLLLVPANLPQAARGSWGSIWGNLLGECRKVGPENGRAARVRSLQKHLLAGGGGEGDSRGFRFPFSNFPQCLKCQAPVGSEQALGGLPYSLSACPLSPSPAPAPPVSSSSTLAPHCLPFLLDFLWGSSSF